jgi:hypothetical protein
MGERFMILRFNNTNPRVKFKVDEFEEGVCYSIMPLHVDDSVAYIAYEGLSFYEAWAVFADIVRNDRIKVPKQFEKYLG